MLQGRGTRVRRDGANASKVASFSTSPIRVDQRGGCGQLQASLKAACSRSLPLLPPTTPSRFDKPSAVLGKPLALPPGVKTFTGVNFHDAYKLAKERARLERLKAIRSQTLLPKLSATSENFADTSLSATAINFGVPTSRPLTQMWRGNVLRNIPPEHPERCDTAERGWNLFTAEIKESIVVPEGPTLSGSLAAGKSRRRLSCVAMEVDSDEGGCGAMRRRASIEAIGDQQPANDDEANRRRSDIRLGNVWQLPGSESAQAIPEAVTADEVVMETEDIEQIRIGFKRFHVAGDEFCIASDDLCSFLIYLGFNMVDEQDVLTILRKSCTLSRFLEFNDILGFMKEYLANDAKRLHIVFAAFVTDGTGEIESTKLRKLARALGYMPFHQLIRETLEDIGITEEDDFLTLEEVVQFFAMCRRRQCFNRAATEDCSATFTHFAQPDVDSPDILRMPCHFLVEALNHVLGHQAITFVRKMSAPYGGDESQKSKRRSHGRHMDLYFVEFLAIARKVREAYVCKFGMECFRSSVGEEAVLEEGDAHVLEKDARLEESGIIIAEENLSGGTALELDMLAPEVDKLQHGEQIEGAASVHLPGQEENGGNSDDASDAGSSVCSLDDGEDVSLFEVLMKLDNHRFSQEDLREHVEKLGFKLRRHVTDEILMEVTGDKNWDDENRRLDFAEYAEFVFRFRQSEGLEKKEVRFMKNVFRLCDADSSGEISRHELVGAFEDLGYENGHQEIDELFDATDADDSGALDMREYLHVVRLHREKDLRNMQREFDKWCDGQVMKDPVGNEHMLDTESQKQGSVMAAAAVFRAVRRLGYDTAGMSEPVSEYLEFADFVEMVDVQRANQVKLRWGKTGFPAETVERFRSIYDNYAVSDGKIRDPQAFSKLLCAFGKDPRSREAQSELMAAFQHAQSFGSKARKLTFHTISEKQSEACSFPKAIEFTQFLCLMELFENERIFEQEAQVEIVTRKLKLLEKEVSAFRKVFVDWAEAPSIWDCNIKQMPGGSDSPGLFREQMSRRRLWNFVKETCNSSLSEQDKMALDKKLASLTVNGQLNWLAFLTVMRWMVDTDYAGISSSEVQPWITDVVLQRLS